MGILGGTIAYWRFPRQEISDPRPFTLPDMMFEIMPEFCPKFGAQNIQSVALLILYVYTLGSAFYHERGIIIMQRFFLVNSLMFLTRTTVVGVTSLPNPNYHDDCLAAQTVDVTFLEALNKVCGGGFPPHACGDLIYSGHTACTFMSMYIFHHMNIFQNLAVKITMWLVAFSALVSIFGCRSHYTVDVVLGLYFAYFLSNWYLLRADGVVKDKCGDLILWYEGADIVKKEETYGEMGNESEEEKEKVVNKL